MLVLEDDAILDDGFFSDEQLLLDITREFGYVRLNAQCAAPSKVIKFLGRHQIVEFRRKVHGALAYLIDSRTARRFVADIVDVYRPVDIEMDRFWAHGIPIRCVHQYPAIERSAVSQLGSRSFEKLEFHELIAWKVYNQVDKIRCWTGL